MTNKDGLHNPPREVVEAPQFKAIWNIMKSWDIGTPAYGGYCRATSGHVWAILDALDDANIALVPIAENPINETPSAADIHQKAQAEINRRGHVGGCAQGGEAAAEGTEQYRVRSAMRRLEVVLDLLDECAMHVAMALGKEKADIDLRGWLRSPLGTPPPAARTWTPWRTGR